MRTGLGLTTGGAEPWEAEPGASLGGAGESGPGVPLSGGADEVPGAEGGEAGVEPDGSEGGCEVGVGDDGEAEGVCVGGVVGTSEPPVSPLGRWNHCPVSGSTRTKAFTSVVASCTTTTFEER